MNKITAENFSVKTNSLLSIKDVSNTYIKREFGVFGKIERKPVLNNVNLELKAGEILGLTGKSGCGKTTLARCILGLIDYNGNIFINGEKQKRNYKMVQMVFQEPGVSLNPCKKIGWLMEEPLVIHKICPSKERAEKIDEMLLRVGLDPTYKQRFVHELSGGQKQRICIGRSLLLQPELLIADEAISSLDVSTGAQILNLFYELRQNLGLSILFISHYKDAIEYLCDRIAVMKNGRIEEF
jgi:ABC-type dipeptide/oligopeptide/nickel transport system ATPase subunit